MTAIWIGLGAIIAGVVIGLLFREFRITTFTLGVVSGLQNRGRDRIAQKLLERAVNEWTLRGELSKHNLRFRLAWLYMAQGRYEDAEAQLRTALSVKHPPNVETMLRQRLVECLEGAGKQDAAQSERERVVADLTTSPRDTDWYFNQAKILEGSRQYAEACVVYQQALADLPESFAALKPRLLTKLALASFHAARAEDCVRYAEEAIALKPDGSTLHSAHQAAGIGYSTLGRLDESEVHRQQAYELDVQAGNQDRAAKTLVGLGLIQMKRGKLVEAIQAAERAVQMSVEARRQARLVEGDCMRLRGQWDQARTAYEQARAGRQMAQPSSERRSQSLLDMALCWLETDTGNLQAAWTWLEHAAPEFEPDPKLGPWHRGTRARLLALRGKTEEAQAALTALEAELNAMHSDEESRRTCYLMIAYAYQQLGQAEVAAGWWQRYLDAKPDLPFRPEGLLGLGRSRLALGDDKGAAAAFQEAVALEMPTHHTRQAREELTRLEEAAPKPHP